MVGGGDSLSSTVLSVYGDDRYSVDPTSETRSSSGIVGTSLGAIVGTGLDGTGGMEGMVGIGLPGNGSAK